MLIVLHGTLAVADGMDLRFLDNSQRTMEQAQRAPLPDWLQTAPARLPPDLEKLLLKDRVSSDGPGSPVDDKLASLSRKEGKWIFASFVMPVPELKASLETASATRATVVFRGIRQGDDMRAFMVNLHQIAQGMETRPLAILRSLDLMYLAEVDPLWNEDELAFFLNPEAVVFANPLAMAACSVDCAVTSVGKPMESLFWCAGCWGNLYPLTGNIASEASPPRDTSLLAARITAGLHRRGMAWKTYGDAALCGGYIYPMLPKQQYRMSTLFPVAEAAEGHCCHYIGETPFKWGEWRTIPAVGEDYVYLLWRYTECCLD